MSPTLLSKSNITGPVRRGEVQPGVKYEQGPSSAARKEGKKVYAREGEGGWGGGGTGTGGSRDARIANELRCAHTSRGAPVRNAGGTAHSSGIQGGVDAQVHYSGSNGDVESSSDGRTLPEEDGMCRLQAVQNAASEGSGSAPPIRKWRHGPPRPPGTTSRLGRWRTPPALGDDNDPSRVGRSGKSSPVWLLATDGRWWRMCCGFEHRCWRGDHEAMSTCVVAEAQARKQGSVSVDGRKPEWRRGTRSEGQGQATV
ncbi:hypothetical protein K438DRAFT_1769534 [Mycena galopus ATCC 62051]|nr:hypothetical protein K438DRAFT_1769534 [Mycena galopus ATCC 62051]